MSGPSDTRATPPENPEKSGPAAVVRAGRDHSADFALGFRAPFRALGLLGGRRELWLPALAPFAATLFLLLVLVPVLIWWTMTTGLLDLPPEAWWNPWDATETALRIAAALAVVMSAVFGFTAIGGVVGAPFHDVLAARTEKALLGPDHEVPEGQPFLPSLLTEAGKVVRMIVLNILLLPVHFVPVVGTALVLLFNFRALGREFVELPLARRRHTLRERAPYMRRHRWGILGLGAGAFCVLLIPLLQLLLFPVLVVAGTVYYLEAEDDEAAD